MYVDHTGEPTSSSGAGAARRVLEREGLEVLRTDRLGEAAGGRVHPDHPDGVECREDSRRLADA